MSAASVAKAIPWQVYALAGAAGVVIVAGYYAKKAILNGAVNPASGNNIVNQAVSAVGAELSGQKDWSLGSWVYDLTHPNEAEYLGLNGGSTVTPPRNDSYFTGSW